MKMLNKKLVRTLSCAAVAVCAAAMLSVGAFAAEVDDTCVVGYLPPQEQMVQGDIALHSADVAVGEKNPHYAGYGAPEGNPIQGNIMLISGDELADTAKTEARYTVKGLLGNNPAAVSVYRADTAVFHCGCAAAEPWFKKRL